MACFISKRDAFDALTNPSKTAEGIAGTFGACDEIFPVSLAQYLLLTSVEVLAVLAP